MASIKTLVNFNGTNGADPEAGLITDITGDLFGTTQAGGTNNLGTVFEIPKTTSGYAASPTVLFNFDGGNGARPVAGLLADTAGNLFGTTQFGGANNLGTVFEIVKTASGYASTPTVLFNFDNTHGAQPLAGLIADAAGNLFGTTQIGGANRDGTVFEIVKTASGYASTPTVLFNFDVTHGANPQAGLIADAAGNLFGTTFAGGTNNDGTVFEIVKTASGYASTPTVLFNFDNTHGAQPVASLIIDAAGDLFGTTQIGGANHEGTVFEIVKTASGYASSPTVLFDFDNTHGANPSAGLITDAAGDLFGTTQIGGANHEGTVFEIVKTASGYASTPTVLFDFDVTHGATPVAGLIIDAAGDLFGTTAVGGANGGGTVFEIMTAQAPTITGTVANQPVTDHATIDPFALVKITDPNVGQTETVTVTPSQTTNGTLFDPNAATNGSTITNGVYKVTGTAAQVTADLDALIFHPTPYQVAPGNTVTTGFTIAVTNSPVGLSATDNTTSVIATAIAPNYPLLQQDATNFLLAQYATDPVVAEATVNGALTKLLTDLGNFVTHPMTSTGADVPITLLNLTLPVALILNDVYAQSPNLAADNATLLGIANTLGHGFHVV